MKLDKENFYALARSESEIFDSIIGAMKHTKKEEARDFLMIMNSVVDFYLARDNQEGVVCYPIIHIPHASKWAREVLLKFLILKLSLYYNQDTRNAFKKELRKEVVLKTEEEQRRYDSYLRPWRSHIRALLKNLVDDYIACDGHKNMIFCSDGDIRVSREDKNPYIDEFYGAIDDIFTTKNLIMCQNLDADEIRAQLREHKEEGDVHIDNAFVFYTNNDKINSLESTSLERWNKAYHVGLKNCFIFDFSEDPFCLRRVLHRGSTLCKKFPLVLEKDFLRYRHFITFDLKEIQFFFKWEREYKHRLIEDDQLMFTDILGSLLDESEYRIQERNRFALCLSPELMFAYQRYLRKEFADYNDEDYQMSFEWQREMVNSYITPMLNRVMHKFSFSNTPHQMAVVIDKSTPETLKTELTHYLQSINSKAKIKYYDYSALKYSKGKNGIKEPNVIVLQYRPHYIRESYAKYPNSFDPYFVNKGQYIFDLIQGFVFNDMYAWDKYDYAMVMHDLMSCDYRDNVLGEYETPTKPTIKRVIGEAEFSDERTGKSVTVYVKGRFDNGQAFSIPETDFVICEIEGTQLVSRLSDLKQNDQLTSIAKLQRLDEVAEALKTFIQKQTAEADKREKVIREMYLRQAKITEEECQSSVALWKILLSKMVRVNGFESIYQSINMELKDNERISAGQLYSWADIDNDMMLPRSKVHQSKLFEFLGFGNSPYLFIMRSKKAATKNNTRTLNTMMDRFLSRTLTGVIDADLFEEISESEINDLLELKNLGDLGSLVDMLREEIHLNTVKEIN